MINYVNGDLFTSPAKVLTNTVNTVGVMGKGIAKTAKEIYPEMYQQYRRLCEEKKLSIGNLWIYKTPHKWILNFPTKEHWKQPSRPEFIEAGLKKFVATYASQGITSIAFPRLGCGNGELSWERQVQPLMAKYLGNLPIDVFVYSFEGRATAAVPEHRDIVATQKWLRSEPRELPFDEAWSDIANVVRADPLVPSWDHSGNARVTVVQNGDEGLLISLPGRSIWERVVKVINKALPGTWHLGSPRPGDVLVPKEALLELWQTIREYGFCVPRVMPGGLDSLAPIILPLLAKLPYLRPVELATDRDGPIRQRGLQFLTPVAEQSGRSSLQTETV